MRIQSVIRTVRILKSILCRITTGDAAEKRLRVARDVLDVAVAEHLRHVAPVALAHEAAQLLAPVVEAVALVVRDEAAAVRVDLGVVLVLDAPREAERLHGLATHSRVGVLQARGEGRHGRRGTRPGWPGCSVAPRVTPPTSSRSAA